MKPIIFLVGSLCVCLAAPVEEDHVRVVRSDSEETDMQTLLTEVRNTLASVNRKPVIQQPVPLAPEPEPEPSQPLPGITVQRPSPPLNDQETNPAAGPPTINLVISTQPQLPVPQPQPLLPVPQPQPQLPVPQPQPQLPVPQPQPQPDILQRLVPGPPFTGLVQGTNVPDTVVLEPCGQTPNSPNSPCYLPLPSGMQQPGSLYSSYNPYLTYPSTPSFFNPVPYQPYPALAGPYPGVGHNYGASPINQHINPFDPYAGHGTQPNFRVTPPIIFREGPRTQA